MYAVGHANPWIADVESSRRRGQAWVAGLAGTAFAAGILVLFGRMAGPGIGQWTWAATNGLGEPWSGILGQAAPALIIFGWLYIIAAAATALQGRPLWRFQGTWPLALLAGLALGAGMFAASVAGVWLAGDVAPAPSRDTPAAGALALGAALVAFQVSAEEVYFRGWLQPLFCADWGPWLGLIATAALFGGLHVIAGAHGPLAVFNLCLGGLMFGLLALRSGGLVAPAAAHFGWNWTESGGLGLNLDASGSLASLRLSGGDLWSGGADGMNGSPALSVALAVAIAILIAAGPVRHRVA